MMTQWQACKEEAKEALLLFRLGDFYEAFYEDATLISKEIGLTLTARQGIPMCGVPFHTAESYIDKLIAKGFKIAIAEQMEDPKEAKGIVKREIVRIVTPGTIVNSGLLHDKKNNYFVSVAKWGSTYGIGALDVTTCEFRVFEQVSEPKAIDELCRLKPSEILVPEPFPFLKELSFHFGFLANERKGLGLDLSTEVLKSHFDVETLDGFGLKNRQAAICAAGALLLYLKEELGLNLEHIRSIESETKEQMAIDRSTMRNLGIDTELTDLLDETYTPMGGRLIRKWIQTPLLCPREIAERQEQISSYMDRFEASKRGREILSQIRDIERLMMRISSGFASPRDVYALGTSLSHLPLLKKTLDLPSLFDAENLATTILNAMNESPPLRVGEGDLFKEGYKKEIDELRKLCRDSMSWMAGYQIRLREESGIKTLKVGYTKAFGYYIEVSRAQSEKVPPSFQRRQTLINAERFITQELKEFEHQVLTAEERLKAIEIECFEELKKEVAREAPSVHAAAIAIAKQDVFLSFAKVAQMYGWVRPQVDESAVFEIVEGRHPVIEKAIGKAAFIPNDTHLDAEKQLMLITGPNMAGKSTYIRQVALIAILAQMGSFVPAKSAHIGLIDKVFSRIGASDDLARGQSTFMVEMSETANILNNATSRSLVLLDEIGRGTSTYDGISIAWAVAEYLLTTPRKMAKTLFATHYWELTKLENEFSHALNFQTAVEEAPSGIVFLRKIVRGGTDKSYGIHVAKLAGIPQKAIRRAEKMLEELEQSQTSQLSLFVEEPQKHPLFQELQKIDPLNLTPLEAQHKLLLLKELSEKLDGV